eukprot:IDg2008t1
MNAIRIGILRDTRHLPLMLSRSESACGTHAYTIMLEHKCNWHSLFTRESCPPRAHTACLPNASAHPISSYSRHAARLSTRPCAICIALSVQKRRVASGDTHVPCMYGICKLILRRAQICHLKTALALSSCHLDLYRSLFRSRET